MPRKIARFLIRHWRLVFFIALLAIAAMTYERIGVKAYLQPSGLDRLRSDVLDLGLKGAIAFTAVYVVFVTLGLPNLPFQLAAGAIWGIWRSYLMMYIGVVLGALGAFLLARTLGRRSIEELFGAKLATLNRRIETGGFRFVLILRLIPMLPFNAINYASGISRIKLREYLTATTIGVVPLTLMHVVFGSAIGELEITNPRTWLHLKVLLPLLASAVLLFIVFISQRGVSRPAKRPNYR